MTEWLRDTTITHARNDAIALGADASSIDEFINQLVERIEVLHAQGKHSLAPKK